MDQRTTYLLQILETIGAPLMGAITAAQSPNTSETLEHAAQTMAGLLAKTVEASIELGNIMDINPAEAQDDTLRVALAGLAGPLVAGQYSKTEQIPESPDLKKTAGALQAVLTFSDNFTPTPETVERLKNLDASGQIVDSYQTQIQYMQAFIPVVEAIAAFPFGQAETKLIMDVSDRLVKKAIELRETLLPGVGDEAAQKRAELGLLRALATLYSACHKAETEKVTGIDADSQSAPLSIDPVWKAFETRAAMLETLAAKMVPGGAQNANASGGGQAPAQPATQPAAPPPEQAAPASPPPPSTPPPAQEQAPAAPPAQGGHNPMSMFAKPKGDGESNGGQAAAPPPSAPPPAQEQPPAAPPPAQPQEPPAAPPTTPPPAQPQTPPENQESTGGQTGSGNPMSFFKKGDEGE